VVPAAIAFLLLPIWSAHNKIKQEKLSQIDYINKAIARAFKSLDEAALTNLNALLDQRHHIQHCRSWSMDTSIFSRVVLYVLTLPLAWIGAALVELALGFFLMG
jgi:hypothetical protein